MYTLDTNVIIYYLKGEATTVPIFEGILAQESPLYISAITEVELFSFSKLTALEGERIAEFLETLAVIAVDSRLARIAGALRREHRLNIADSVIAATALFTGTILLTRNIQDFNKVPNLLIQKI